ncbi:sigma-54-dependent Fis family transcriptional regulator [Acinetobacter nectaris]|nr:sigma-54 dependent transcriptional regulator [Acinetobacter nectaris]MCF9047192.1 sigma-54-dependent Fis family transcriptional regulator [Acinetobacter nectaris]
MKQIYFANTLSFQDFTTQYLVLNNELSLEEYQKDNKILYVFYPKYMQHLEDVLLENYIQAQVYIDNLNHGYLCIIPQISKLEYLGDYQKDLTKYLTSQSSSMEKMFNILKKVAKTSFPVLVRGESGAGKEKVAQLVHQFGKRFNSPFISVNCASINENLLESELFGHVKGAFTGAIRDHKGVFERANHGTLFLDEIAELPLNLQAKLLRVLETGEFTPLGGEKTIVTDVRIVTATHRALREEAKNGRFRYDLLYRLRVIPIFVPPLRERKEDIPLLAKRIIYEYAKDYPSQPVIDPAVFSVFESYDWPGNIRELKNTLLYALTMAYGEQKITTQDLPQELLLDSLYTSTTNSLTKPQEKAKMSKALLSKTLQETEFDIQETLKQLNISRSTLWRYRKKWDI